MIYKQVFPTKWPMFQFSVQIWKLSIATAFLSPAVDSASYEYIVIIITWGVKELFRIRLFDTWVRTQNRLEGLLTDPSPVTFKKLQDIKEECEREMAKFN